MTYTNDRGAERYKWEKPGFYGGEINTRRKKDFHIKKYNIDRYIKRSKQMPLEEDV